MKSKYSACSAVMILLSTLWTLPASAQSFEIGVWYRDLPDGSSTWLAFSGTKFVAVNTNSNIACGGQVLAAYTDTYVVMDNTVSATLDVRCKGVPTFDFPLNLTYDSGADTLNGIVAIFHKVNNGNPDPFIEIVRKWKSNSDAEWEFLGLVTNPPPVLAPPPGAGADCTAPPNLGPGADLTNCDLAGTDFTGIDLNGADLSGANLSGANLREQDLRFTTLFGAILQAASLQFADLTGANLSGANLSGAFLNNTELINANLSGAILNNTELIIANLSGAILQSASLQFADLTGANLSGANLSEAFLFFANLTFADLSGADLTFANLGGADLSGADLSDASLIGADLSQATVNNVVFANTICPDFTNSDSNGGTCIGFGI